VYLEWKQRNQTMFFYSNCYDSSLYSIFHKSWKNISKQSMGNSSRIKNIQKGKAIINLIALRPNEKVTSILSYDNTNLSQINNDFVFMSTKKGTVKKTPFKDFANIRTNGIIAIRLGADDELLWVKITNGKKNIILTTKDGKAIVFKEKEIRPTGRSSIGVKGIKLNEESSCCFCRCIWRRRI